MEPKEYQAQAAVTVSGQYHGELVSFAELRQRMHNFIKAAEALDEVKKALFYGRGGPIGATASPQAQLSDDALFRVLGYERQEGQTLQDVPERERKYAEIVLHMIIGKATESGELVEALFKTVFGFTALDRVNVIEEIGDGLWYDANLLTVLEAGFEDAFNRNIGKLRKRFPDGFTEYDANNRDLAAERVVLEGRVNLNPASPDFGQVTIAGPMGEAMNSASTERLTYAPDERRPPDHVGSLNGEPGQPGDPEPR